jgi:hypothetical protein
VDREKVGERVVTGDEQIVYLFQVVLREEHVGLMVHIKINMYKIVFPLVSHLHVS